MSKSVVIREEVSLGNKKWLGFSHVGCTCNSLPSKRAIPIPNNKLRPRAMHKSNRENNSPPENGLRLPLRPGFVY